MVFSFAFFLRRTVTDFSQGLRTHPHCSPQSLKSHNNNNNNDSLVGNKWKYSLYALRCSALRKTNVYPRWVMGNLILIRLLILLIAD